jgi:ABC-type multidrug transport system ATPase subunit
MTQPASDQTVLDIDELRVGYPGEPLFVDRWSARLPAGFTLLYGDTGSGKTSVLRALAGTTHAGAARTTGRLSIGGASATDDAERYARQVFFHDADATGFDQLDARACAAAVCAIDRDFDDGLWAALVTGFGLEPHAAKPLYMLSTGSRRKVWLAAALACGRPLILLDEPCAALDAPSIRCLWSTIARIASTGRQAVIVASADNDTGVPPDRVVELPIRAG